MSLPGRLLAAQTNVTNAWVLSDQPLRAEENGLSALLLWGSQRSSAPMVSLALMLQALKEVRV